MEIIKTSSYTDSFPTKSCNVKVAIKNKDWKHNDCVKSKVYENSIYDSGFVSVDGGKNFYLAGNFIFHKLKRTK